MALTLRTQSHIVVVDSRPRDYDELASLAGEWQWHLHFLTTARAAVTFLRRARADLWMINARLSDMSGFTLYEILREQVAGASTIIVSDQYDAQEERLTCGGGAILYVCKGPAHSIAFRSLLQSLTIPGGHESGAPLTGGLLESMARPVADSAAKRMPSRRVPIDVSATHIFTESSPVVTHKPATIRTTFYPRCNHVSILQTSCRSGFRRLFRQPVSRQSETPTGTHDASSIAADGPSQDPQRHAPPPKTSICLVTLEDATGEAATARLELCTLQRLLPALPAGQLCNTEDEACVAQTSRERQ